MAFNIQTKSCILRLDHIICAHGFAQALNWYVYIPNTIIHNRVLNLQILSFKIQYTVLVDVSLEMLNYMVKYSLITFLHSSSTP